MTRKLRRYLLHPKGDLEFRRIGDKFCRTTQTVPRWRGNRDPATSEVLVGFEGDVPLLRGGSPGGLGQRKVLAGQDRFGWAAMIRARR